MQTLAIEGTVTGIGEGNSGTYTFDTKLPNRYYSELIVGGKRIIEAYNGKSAWREDASGSPVTMFSQDFDGDAGRGADCEFAPAESEKE